jgi:hypothetical protein
MTGEYIEQQKKTLLLHDLPAEEGGQPSLPEIITVFPALPEVKSCVGCFQCWLKTPGKCAIRDRAAGFAGLMAAHDDLIIISRLLFGGFSPAVKAVLDRGIGYMSPLFRVVEGQMHHRMRSEHSLALRVLFYGKANALEHDTAEKLVPSIALNLGVTRHSYEFCESGRQAVTRL